MKCKLNVLLADFMYLKNLPVWIVKTDIIQFDKYFQNVLASVSFKSAPQPLVISMYKFSFILNEVKLNKVR